MEKISCLWNSFKIAFAMYSKIPMPKADWKTENMRYTMCFFPLVGIIIGALMYGFGYLATKVEMGSLLRSTVYVLIPVLVTGGIHLDGFLDTADALSSYQSKERKLEILKDSHAGAFAIIVGICYFVCAVGVWSEITLEQMKILGVMYVMTRSLSGLSVVSFPCASNSGLVAMFSGAAQKRRVAMTMIVYLIGSGIYLFIQSPIYGSVVLGCGFATFLYYRWMSKKEFGGITGDLAGYFVQVCELVVAVGVVVTGFILK